MTETPVPVVTETPAPVVTETPAPVVTETPAPAVTETPVPAAEPLEEDYLWPVPSGTLMSRGYIPSHRGLDINGQGGEVVATKTGTVVRLFGGCHNVNGAAATGHACTPDTCEYNHPSFHSAYARYFCNWGYGNIVVFQHSDGSGYSIYTHLESFSVAEGDTVRQGGVLGVMGSTGASTGRHVHFELCEDIEFVGDFPKPIGSINNEPANIRYVYSATTEPQTHVHNLIHVPEVRAAADRNGSIEYWFCSGCGKYFADAAGETEITAGELVTAPLAHTHFLLHIGATAPTEERGGNIEYWYCSGCGRYFLDENAETEVSRTETVIPKTGEDRPPVVAAPGEVHFEQLFSYPPNWFVDVSTGDWFYNAVESAFEMDLMRGMGPDETGRQLFNPKGNVTVAEAVTMAARINCINALGREYFQQSTGNNWYQVYLDYALEHGIIGRDIYNNTDVTQAISRSQFAEILAKALPDDRLLEINQVPDGVIPDVPSTAGYAASVYKLYRAGILMGNDNHGTFVPGSKLTRAEAAAVISRMAESSTRIRRDLTVAEIPEPSPQPAAVG